MVSGCNAQQVSYIRLSHALTAPSPLVGKGWGGGSLLSHAAPQQPRPPPLAPPNKGEGNERPTAIAWQGRVAGRGVGRVSPRRRQRFHGGAKRHARGR